MFQHQSLELSIILNPFTESSHNYVVTMMNVIANISSSTHSSLF